MSNDQSRALTGSNKTLFHDKWLAKAAELFTDHTRGNLDLYLPDGQALRLGSDVAEGPQAKIVLRSLKPLSHLFLRGELAFAQSYMDGEWDSPDLTALFAFALANENKLSNQGLGSTLLRYFHRLRHLMNRNSRRGSKRNIAYHYDLGNDFYRTWLDDTMTYSSAMFDRNTETFEHAQQKKYRTIADMAELQPSDNVLEIGCGWGGFSELAARDIGCRIEGLTLSREQQDYAQNRYARAGVGDRAVAAYRDYRDASGTYDKIVSIEMFEAVGEENWPTYFRAIRERLKPGGIAVLQVITINDDIFEDYRKGADFIQRYIFPGGFLPSPGALAKAVSEGGLNLDQTHFFGASYARTCELWNRRFQHAWPDIERMGYDHAFKRMWEYYLSYCEVGFQAGRINVGLFKISKPA